jgi:hypothetical protein
MTIKDEREIPHRSDRAVYRPLAYGDGVLLDLDTGQYHGVNQTGAAIWELIDGRRSVREIADEFYASCDEVPDDADEALQRFLVALDERDLVAFTVTP